MGRSRLIPFVVNYTCQTGFITPGEYHTKYCGKPSAAGLAKHVADLNASFLPGGVNEHIGARSTVVAANLVNQKTMTVVATWVA